MDLLRYGTGSRIGDEGQGLGGLRAGLLKIHLRPLEESDFAHGVLGHG